MIAILSPSLSPPPLSTCLCARLLLIFEALSFVFVRCPKDYAMKRDRWRGAGWLWLWCVTACTHTHMHTVTAESCRQSSPVILLYHSFCVSFTHHYLLRNTGRVKRSNVKFNWNCTELEERKGDQQTNHQRTVQDRWASQLPESVCLCVFGLIRPMSWRGPELVPFLIKQNWYLS